MVWFALFLCCFSVLPRVRSVFSDPTSTSSLPADWWRRTWSSPSHYRQVLTPNWILRQTWRVLEQPMFPLQLLSTFLSHFLFPKARHVSFTDPKAQSKEFFFIRASCTAAQLQTSCVPLMWRFPSAADSQPSIWMNSFITAVLFLKCHYWRPIALKYHLYKLHTNPAETAAKWSFKRSHRVRNNLWKDLISVFSAQSCFLGNALLEKLFHSSWDLLSKKVWTILNSTEFVIFCSTYSTINPLSVKHACLIDCSSQNAQINLINTWTCRRGRLVVMLQPGSHFLQTYVLNCDDAQNPAAWCAYAAGTKGRAETEELMGAGRDLKQLLLHLSVKLFIYLFIHPSSPAYPEPGHRSKRDAQKLPETVPQSPSTGSWVIPGPPLRWTYSEHLYGEAFRRQTPEFWVTSTGLDVEELYSEP